MRERSGYILAGLVVVHAALRLWGLTDGCLWFDEIFSIHAAEHTWAGLIEFVAKDLIHPPLSYVLLKLWISAGGEGLLWLRMFPVFFSVLALVPLWMFCRELKLKVSTIAVTFALVAVNGALIKYAQEVRMYSLLLFLSLTSIWLFSRFFFRGKSFWMLVLVNVLLVYSHYFGWFVVASEVAAIAIAQRIKILQTLLMFAVTAAAFVPWIIAVLRFSEPESSITQNIGWMARPGLRAVAGFGFDLVDPFYFQQNSIEASANFAIAIPLIAVLIAAGAAYLVNFKNVENKQSVLFLIVFATFPLVLAFALSWVLPVSIWGSRHLLIVFPPIIVLLAIFLTEAAPPVLRSALCIAALALTGAGLVMHLRTGPQDQIWCSYGPLAEEWTSSPMTGADPKKLYVFEDLVAYHYWFAKRNYIDGSVILLKSVAGMPNDPAYFLPRGFEEVAIADSASIDEEEIWISFRQPTADTKARFEAPVTTFENLGYVTMDVRKEVVGPQTAFLIRMTKRPLSTQ